MAHRSPTEAVLDSAKDLDRRSVEEILDVIHREDQRAFDAVGKALPQLGRAVEALVGVLRDGGRWFNVGAGTSGRLGALDAAEIPPTFGLASDRVQAIVAGGAAALAAAIEGAEDDAEAAAAELRERGLAAGDAVVGISASGLTPYARGAVEAGTAVGARTIAITCNPDSPLAEAVEIPIAVLVGPEVIAGSTRVKGGLAQKMVLHMLSTAVMVRLGRVEGNLMTHLKPASQKLRRRAIRIVMTLGGVSEDRARELLDACGGKVPAAIESARGSP